MSSEQPIEEKYREQMRELAVVLDKYFNPKGGKEIGFSLLVFAFGGEPGNRTNYISNANRKDMLDTMREFIARAEGQIKDKEFVQ